MSNLSLAEKCYLVAVFADVPQSGRERLLSFAEMPESGVLLGGALSGKFQDGRLSIGCGRRFWTIDMIESPPSAYHVAVAIFAAAREMGADPLAVCETMPRGRARPASRARMYATIALRRRFKMTLRACGRCVGAGAPDVYVSQLEADVRKGYLRWWDAAVVDRVCAAIDWAMEREPIVRPEAPAEPIIMPAFLPPPRPAESPRQIAARLMLEEAARNTAALPIS